MIILVLADQVNYALGATIGVLNSCGFKTRVIERGELRRFSTQTTIIISKHPRKRYNGSGHRRRFALYRYDGFRSIGYAEGADREVDCLWWRDLFCKIRCLIWDEIPEQEQMDLIIPLARLKEWGD